MCKDGRIFFWVVTKQKLHTKDKQYILPFSHFNIFVSEVDFNLEPRTTVHNTITLLVAQQGQFYLFQQHIGQLT
jgi:hypothetical protein